MAGALGAITFPAMLLATLLAAADTLAAFMGPGVSLALARHRAQTIRDVRYELTLDVTARDSAVGRVIARFHRYRGADLILDFRGRRLTTVAANGRPVARPEWNGAHLRIPAAALVEGENWVEVGFVSEIAPSGASIIRFEDADDGNRYLYTLLVPADANQLFPCFDQPDLKAVVVFSLTMPPEWIAVANASLTSIQRAPRAVTWSFVETSRISTYLIAFAAGPWHRVARRVEGHPVTGYVRRSRAREADLDSLIAINGRGLTWMEQYFGRDYPFGKFDFVLAPAFPFGGMEHPGAVFYNEDRFIFRERPTLPRRLGRVSTVLHEVAHMWFGDLVTMRWFDDLWLKEGFATYVAAKALADLEPAGNAWKTFYLSNKPAAYGVDQTGGTTPVWQELANLDQAKSNYGPIVYNKAPSVLKQLEFLVGDSAFRDGVRLFLTRHAFANATWRDLLAAIGEAAGRPLDRWGGQFILRAGMPELEQRLRVRGGRIERLELVQRPVQALSGPGAWPMRTRVLLAYGGGQHRALDVELAGETTVVREAAGLPAPAYVFANADDYGYLLARLDSASIAHLEAGGLAAVEDGLLRAMLWTALWDEVRAARMDPARFARLALAGLPRETDEQIAPALIGRLGRAVGPYLRGDTRSRLTREVEDALWAAAADASRSYGLRKAALDGFIDVARTEAGVERLGDLLAADSAAGEPLRDPTRWDIVTRLVALGAPGAAERLQTQAARDTTPDGRRRAFIAGAAQPTAEAKAEYFRRYFADPSLNEDWASGSLGAFNTVDHQRLTRGYLEPALDSLRYIQANRRIFFLGTWLGSFLSGQTEPEALRVTQDWLARQRGLPHDLRRKVLQYLDELERTVRIRSRWGPVS